jgi:DNA repair exonuclease SbcCD ATPase subunit
MAKMFNVDELRRRIEALIRDNEDLADDEVLKLDMLEGETDIYSVLTELFNASAETVTMMRAITERLQTLSERRARFGRRVDHLRDLMLMVLQSAELQKIELPDATLSQRAGTQKVIGEADVAALPDELCRVKREPDLVAIKARLLDHREVPGLSLSNAPPVLMVKVK